jgi:hypothetical protein
MTLQVGTPEHTTFGTALDLAQEELKMQGWDEGFMATAATHKKLFKPDEDYSLLVDDFQYIIDLSVQALARHQSLAKH